MAALALPFLALLLWNAHVDAAFPAGAASYHAMRSERLLLNYSLHSPQEIRQVAQLFLGKVFSLTRTPLTLGFLGWNAAFFAAAASCRKTNPKASRGLLGWILFADGVTALYLGALYLTYITSMPLEEALALAAFDRYFAVAWAYTSGVSTYLLCRKWAAEQAQTRRALLALGLILPLAYGAVFTVSFREVYARRPYQGSFYQLVDDQIAPLGLDSGAYSYYVIGPADGIRGGTTGSYLKYKLLSMEISVDEDPPDSQHIYSASQNYDYLLVLQDSDAVREFFQGYPQYAGRDSYVGLYPLPLW